MKEPIAIIGMAGLFPQAENVQQYWKNIIEKIDCITDIPETHWNPSDFFDADPTAEDKTYCKRGGFIPEIKFDPMEFGIPPGNLEATDCSQLLALYCAKEALIDAGYWSDSADFSNTGIILGYSGYGNTTVPLSARLQYPIWKKVFESAGLSQENSAELIKRIKSAFVPWQENSFPGFLGNIVAGRVANRLNLGGINCVVDSACASSIAALKLSIEELRNKQCDMIISGGVDTNNTLFSYVCFSKTPALSIKQDATPFDAAADGMLLAEGIGMLVLKRLSDAEKAQDYIYAVIKGVGASSDGKLTSIYSTRPEGQVKALLQAYKNADVKPETIGLIEAHAPGTLVGDSAEITALKTVFAKTNNRNQTKIAIGSVKSQIGHSKSAAGVASLIKVALALDQQILPATIKLKNLHPNIDPENTPLYINTEVIPWIHAKKEPRRAGISSFGFGGTNFHIVLEEYVNKKQKKISKQQNYYSLIFSKETKAGLIKHCKQEIDNLNSNTNYFNEILNQQKQSKKIPKTFPRIGLIIESKQNAIDLLHKVVEQLQKNDNTTWNLPNIFYRNSAFEVNKIVAVFPGQGSQYQGMLKQLGLQFAEVRNSFEVLENLNPDNTSWHDIPFSENLDLNHNLNRTENVQPLLGVASQSYYTILRELGFSPNMLLGHSFGELSALWAAGCFNDHDYLQLAIERGRAMTQGKDKKTGSMLVVNAAGTQIVAEINEFSALAVVNFNSPTQCVISGCSQEIKLAKQKLETKGFNTQLLSVSNAFHTSFVEHAVRKFSEEVTKIQFHSPKIPVFCNATNENYPQSVSQIRKNIAKAISNPVYFEKNIQSAYENGGNLFVEIGPNKVLSGLIKQILKDKDILSLSLGASTQQEEEKALQMAITQLKVAGIDLANLQANQWQFKKEKEYSDSTIRLNGANYVKPETKQKFQDALAKPIADIVQTKAIIQNDSIKINEILETQKIAAKNYLQYLENQTAYLKIIENMQDSIVKNNSRQDILKMFETQIAYFKEMQTSEELKFNSFLNQQIQQIDTNYDNKLFALTISSSTNNSSEIKVSEVNLQIPQGKFDDINNLNQLQEKLIGIIASSTGYPAEAIEINMDLEADLGIDSIKRVEILNQFRNEFDNNAVLDPSKLIELRTIQDIINYIKSKDTINLAKDNPETLDKPRSSLDFAKHLIDIIAKTTGYPAEAIEVNMDLEADLGIDSIKRVEIFNQLKQQFPNKDSIDISKLGELRTIQNILNYLEGFDNLDILSIENATNSQINLDNTNNPIKRYEISTKPLEMPNVLDIQLSKNKVCLITGEPNSLTKEYAQFFKEQGMIPIHLTLDARITQKYQSYYLSSTDEHVVKHAIEKITAEIGSIGGFLHVHPKLTVVDSVTKLITEKDEQWSLLIFSLAKHLTKQWVTTKNNVRPFFIITNYGDGKLGTTTPSYPILGQALSGLCKSLQQEWATVFVRYINFHNQLDSKQILDYFSQEIFDANNILAEVGYTNMGERVTLIAQEAQLLEGNSLDIYPTDVILVTGGGRGITAACIKQMSKQRNAIYIIVGRTDITAEIPESLQNITDEALLKKAIFDYLKNNSESALPKQVEQYYRNIIAIQEIKKTLMHLESNDVTVAYIKLDITDTKQVKQQISKIQKKYGTLTGLIHGAGNLADKHIHNKTITDYKTVIDTKVKGLTALLSTLMLKKLKFIVLFSSVVGFYGNAGQTDYAIANEVLNKIAYSFTGLLPDCKIVAINWGPWAIGMVNPTLIDFYEQYGVKTISEDMGTQFFLNELFHGLPSVQIILGQEIQQYLNFPLENVFPARVSQQFNPEKNRFLLDHVVGKKSVFPMTFILDWMIKSVVELCKGYQVARVEDFKVFSGITWEKADLEKTLILDLKMNNTIKSQEEINIEAIISINSESSTLKPQNYRAIIILTKKQAGIYNDLVAPEVLISENVVISHDKIYPGILFHGPSLQFVEKIMFLDSTKITGILRQNDKSDLTLFNPYVTDAILQFINIWTYKNFHIMVLPLFIKKIEQVSKNFSKIVFVEAHCSKVSDSMIVADVFGYDKNLRCALKLCNVQAFSNPTLSVKYRQNSLMELAEGLSK